MERRKFLRNGGLLGAMFGAGAGAVAMTQQPEAITAPAIVPIVPKEDISHLAPPNSSYNLQINGSYPTEEPPQERMRVTSDGSFGIGTSPYMFAPMNPVITNSVIMSVGKDNRLWLKIDDKWHRVALES